MHDGADGKDRDEAQHARQQARVDAAGGDQHRQEDAEGAQAHDVAAEGHDQRGEREQQEHGGNVLVLRQEPRHAREPGRARDLVGAQVLGRRKHAPDPQRVVEIDVARVGEQELVAAVELQVVRGERREMAVQRIERHPVSAQPGFDPLMRGALDARLEDDAADQPRRDAVEARERGEQPALAVAARLAEPQCRERIGEALERRGLDLVVRVVEDRAQHLYLIGRLRGPDPVPQAADLRMPVRYRLRLLELSPQRVIERHAEAEAGGKVEAHGTHRHARAVAHAVLSVGRPAAPLAQPASRGQFVRERERTLLVTFRQHRLAFVADGKIGIEPDVTAEALELELDRVFVDDGGKDFVQRRPRRPEVRPEQQRSRAQQQHRRTMESELHTI